MVMDGCRSINPMPSATSEEVSSRICVYMRLEANNYRWRFTPGAVKCVSATSTISTPSSTRPTSLCRCWCRFAYHQRIPLLEEGGDTLRFTGLVKYDNETGCRQHWDYGQGVFGSEAVYAPKSRATRG